MKKNGAEFFAANSFLAFYTGPCRDSRHPRASYLINNCLPSFNSRRAQVFMLFSLNVIFDVVGCFLLLLRFLKIPFQKSAVIFKD